MTEPATLTPPVNRATTAWPPAITLAVAPKAVAVARRFVRDVVSGHAADAYTIALVASELVTNAMRAAARVGRLDATITLSLAATDRWTHLRVTDPSPVPPTRRTAGDGEESGRGMTVIPANGTPSSARRSSASSRYSIPRPIQILQGAASAIPLGGGMGQTPRPTPPCRSRSARS